MNYMNISNIVKDLDEGEGVAIELLLSEGVTERDIEVCISKGLLVGCCLRLIIKRILLKEGLIMVGRNKKMNLRVSRYDFGNPNGGTDVLFEIIDLDMVTKNE